MHYTDAHTHLNSDELFPDREKYLTDFMAVWWVWLVNVWVDAVWNERAVVIAQQSLSMVWLSCVVKATLGLHPSEVSYGHIHDQSTIKQACSWLEHMLQKNASCVVGLGECGIDAHYPWFTDRVATLQQELFYDQCLLARKYALPVVVHSRDSFARTYEVLSKFTDLRIYFHCRSYGPQEIEQLLVYFPSLWFWFCGNCTYPKATSLRDSFLMVINHPLYQTKRLGVLVETDAPRLSPQSRRGKPHAPRYIPEQYTFLANLAGQRIWLFVDRVYADRLLLYT